MSGSRFEDPAKATVEGVRDPGDTGVERRAGERSGQTFLLMTKTARCSVSCQNLLYICLEYEGYTGGTQESAVMSRETERETMGLRTRDESILKEDRTQQLLDDEC